MESVTKEFLETMANQLGTTSEYLWGVLLSQAPISATISLLFFIMMCVVVVALYILHTRFMKRNSIGDNFYDLHKSSSTIMGLAAIWTGVVFLYSVSTLENFITGYFNPEFWALKQIMDAIF